MRKKYFVLLIIILIGVICFIFTKKLTKKNITGNNMNSQEIVNYILDISSYEATIDVEVNSNKNITKYELKQKYVKPDIVVQEVLQPENIKGVKIIKKENELIIENTKLGLKKILNGYDYIANNSMDLNTFIDLYRNSKNSNYKEKDSLIVMETEYNGDIQKLFIDKKDIKPIKMEIRDNNKKNSIYISYKEITFNNTKREEILAFENIMKNEQT